MMEEDLMLDDSGENSGYPVESALQALRDVFIGPDHVEVDEKTSVGQHEPENVLKALIAMT